MKFIMRRTVKRESVAAGGGSGKREPGDSEGFRSVKKEKEKEKNKGVDDSSVRIDEPPTQEEEMGISDRRVLRSQYLALMNKISGTYRHFLLTLLFPSSLCSLIDFA